MRMVVSLLAPMCAFAGVLNADQTLAEAKAALSPFMGDLKKLDPADIERVIYNQWFDWAHELIAKSHEQGADLSFAVRKATRTLKNQADELVRALNPKYGVAQLVNPSFRWAQNDTSVFLNVKFSTRWNAPGALEVYDAGTDFQKGLMNFTGFGEHSNLKYKYELVLDLFDYIVPESCTWSAASVGRLSIILRKKWARKWPRLLVNKKQKISNMFHWMDFQESQNLDNVSTADHSPASCVFDDQLYCLANDKCVAKDRCAEDCKQSSATTDMCAGKPSKPAKVSFTDVAMEKTRVQGTFKVSMESHTFDVDTFELHWTDAEGTRSGLLASIPYAKEATFDLTKAEAPRNTHVEVVTVNSFGEHDGKNGKVEIEDGYLPLKRVTAMPFTDSDKAHGKLGGSIVLTMDAEFDFTEVTLYWGKSKTQKIKSGALIKTHKLESEKQTSVLSLTSETIPSGAKYVLIFPTNKHGEGSDPEAVKFDDVSPPCSNDTTDADDCIKEITVTDDSNIDRGKATFELIINAVPRDVTDTTHVVVYLGQSKCDPTGEKDGQMIKEISLDDLLSSLNTISFVDVDIPETTTTVQVYTKNQHGESKNCASADLIDNGEFKNEGPNRHLGRTIAHMIKNEKGALKILKRVAGFTGNGKNFSELSQFIEEAWKNETIRTEFGEAIQKYLDKKAAKKKKKEKDFLKHVEL